MITCLLLPTQYSLIALATKWEKWAANAIRAKHMALQWIFIVLLRRIKGAGKCWPSKIPTPKAMPFLAFMA